MLFLLNRWLKKAFYRANQKEAYFRIVNINLASQEVVFQVKNKSLTISCTFLEAVGSPRIVNYLSSSEACFLGGYFAKTLKKGSNRSGALKKTRSQSFLLKSQGGKYQISFQARSGAIGYFHKKTKKEFIDDPVAMANNVYLIGQFSPCQACYIGILAGAYMEKSLGPDKLTARRPVLRVVK